MQIYNAIAEKPDKHFSARLEEKTFAFAGNWLENLKSEEILCVHRPTSLNTVQEYKKVEIMDSVFVH